MITRIDQLIVMRKFIEGQVEKFRESEGDLVMICGDFNVNARQHSYPMHFLNDAPEMKVRMNCEMLKADLLMTK